MSVTDKGDGAPKVADPPPRINVRIPEFLSAQFVLMLLAVGLFGATLYVLAFVEIPAGNKDVLVTLAGVVGTSYSTLIGFHFGSSRSSQVKDAVISNSTPTASPEK